jgi:alkylation response protein AidB-like acyl-CoA dehydrogenase
MCFNRAIQMAHGPLDIRKAIAAGQHLTTLALSEARSRSHFWAPISTATASNGHIQLDAHKSWATAASQVDSYVWSSRPLAAEGASTIWLVPGNAAGLRIPAPFNGLGLRGNHSSPVTAAVIDIPTYLRAGGQKPRKLIPLTLIFQKVLDLSIGKVSPLPAVRQWSNALGRARLA